MSAPPVGGREPAGPIPLRGIGESLLSLLAFGGGRALFLLLVSNIYGAATLGIVALATVFMVLLALLLGVGAESSATFLAGRRPASIPLLRRNAPLQGVCSLLVSIPVLALAYRVFGDSVFSDFGTTARLSLPLMVGCQVAQQQLQGLYVGLGDFRAVTRGHVLQHVALLVGVVALAAADLPGEAVLPLFAGSLALKAGYQSAMLPSGEGRFRLGERLSLLVEQYQEGLHMMLGSLANLLNYRLDSIFIAFFLGTREVGLYAAATVVAEATLYLPRGLGQAAFSWSSSLGIGRDERGLQALGSVRRLFLMLALSALLLAILVGAVLTWALPALFGPEFEGAVPSARVLLAAAYFNGLGLLAMSLLYGTGHARLNSRAGAAAVVLNVVANLVLIPRLGILGAAIGSLLSYTTYAAFAVLGLREAIRRPRVVEMLLPRRPEGEKGR